MAAIDEEEEEVHENNKRQRLDKDDIPPELEAFVIAQEEAEEKQHLDNTPGEDIANDGDDEDFPFPQGQKSVTDRYVTYFYFSHNVLFSKVRIVKEFFYVFQGLTMMKMNLTCLSCLSL